MVDSNEVRVLLLACDITQKVASASIRPSFAAIHVEGRTFSGHEQEWAFGFMPEAISPSSNKEREVELTGFEPVTVVVEDAVETLWPRETLPVRGAAGAFVDRAT